MVTCSAIFVVIRHASSSILEIAEVVPDPVTGQPVSTIILRITASRNTGESVAEKYDAQVTLVTGDSEPKTYTVVFPFKSLKKLDKVEYELEKQGISANKNWHVAPLLIE